MNMERASIKKSGFGWKGVRRDERGKIVWECEHEHRNRDCSTPYSGMSALDCANGVTLEQIEKRFADEAREREEMRMKFR